MFWKYNLTSSPSGLKNKSHISDSNIFFPHYVGKPVYKDDLKTWQDFEEVCVKTT